MDVFLRRNFWMLPILVVAICALLLGSTASNLIAAHLVHAEPAPRAAARKRPPPPRPAPSKDAEAVIARNMFCSTCEAGAAPAPAPGDRPAPSALPLMLVATARHGAGWSATIMSTASARGGAYGEGDPIGDVGTVKRIGAQWVDIENGRLGRVERLYLVAQAAPPPVPVVQPPVAASDGEGIKQVADNRFEIDRGLVDKALADPMSVRDGARFMPAIEDGRAVGIRLSGIKPTSVFGRMGFKNGDQIQTINGYDLTSPDRAIEAYTKLRSATSLQVAVNRRGTPVKLEYSIR